MTVDDELKKMMDELEEINKRKVEVTKRLEEIKPQIESKELAQAKDEVAKIARRIRPRLFAVEDIRKDLIDLERELLPDVNRLREILDRYPQAFEGMTDVEKGFRIIESRQKEMVERKIPTGGREYPLGGSEETEYLLTRNPPPQLEDVLVFLSDGEKTLEQFISRFGASPNAILIATQKWEQRGIMERNQRDNQFIWNLTLPDEKQMYYYIRDKPRTMDELRQKFVYLDDVGRRKQRDPAVINIVLKRLIAKKLVEMDDKIANRLNPKYFVRPTDEEMIEFFSVDPRDFDDIRRRFPYYQDWILNEQVARLEKSGQIKVSTKIKDGKPLMQWYSGAEGST